MGYVKQLDSVRAIAVFMVIIWHWLPRNSFIEKILPGPTGVNLFFVLSGFLITQILLDNRCKAEQLNTPKQHILKSFYIRRVLRIFPAYYFTIFLSLFLGRWLGLSTTRGEVISNLTYTSNFYDYLQHQWPAATPHFWSLAVEEQFYLIWPLLMLFLPGKKLLYAIFLFILVGFISQTFLTDYEFGYLLPNTCFDCFGAGALLAWIVVYRPKFLPTFFKITSVLSLAALTLFVMYRSNLIFLTQVRFLNAIWGIWIISYILMYRNKKNLVITLLGNRLAVNIGKVSYGIYLYHILFLFAAASVWYRFVFNHLPGILKPYDRWIFLAVNFWILYFICVLSWKFLEKPILSLKKKFRYQEDAAWTQSKSAEVLDAV